MPFPAPTPLVPKMPQVEANNTIPGPDPQGCFFFPSCGTPIGRLLALRDGMVGRGKVAWTSMSHIISINTIHQHPSHLRHGFSWKSFKHLDKIHCWWHIIPVYHLKVVVYQHLSLHGFFPAFTFSCIPINIFTFQRTYWSWVPTESPHFLVNQLLAKLPLWCNVCLVIPHELSHRNPRDFFCMKLYNGRMDR